MVTGANMICACRHTPMGVAPWAHLGDGRLDLILVRKTGRLNYWRYLFRTGYLWDSPFDLPFVTHHKVSEFTFTPKENEANILNLKTKSVWNCDGEVLPNPGIAIKVHQQILPVFARGIERKVE